MADKKSQKYNSIWSAIGIAIGAFFVHGCGQHVDSYQSITLGKSWKELRSAHVCSLASPVGLADMNSNVNQVKYSQCTDFETLGKKRTVFFEFINNKLSKATIFMGWGDWEKTFPTLEKQFGQPSKNILPEDVEAQSKDAAGSFLRVYFGKSDNIYYRFGNNFSSQFETIVLESSSRDDDFKAAAKQ